MQCNMWIKQLSSCVAKSTGTMMPCTRWPWSEMCTWAWHNFAVNQTADRVTFQQDGADLHYHSEVHIFLNFTFLKWWRTVVWVFKICRKWGSTSPATSCKHVAGDILLECLVNSWWCTTNHNLHSCVTKFRLLKLAHWSWRASSDHPRTVCSLHAALYLSTH